MLIEKLFSNLISELKYSEHGIVAISKVLAGHISTIGNYTNAVWALQAFATVLLLETSKWIEYQTHSI